MCHLTQILWKMEVMIKLDEQIPKNIILKNQNTSNAKVL